MTIGNSKTVLTFGRIKELTAENAELFRREVQASVDGQQVIKVDLSQTTSMDCAGLGALVALRNLARDHHSKVRLLNPTTPVQRLFDLMHLEAAFEIVHASPETQLQICESPLPLSRPRPVSAEISNREPELVAQPALERGQSCQLPIHPELNRPLAVMLDRTRPRETLDSLAQSSPPLPTLSGLLAQLNPSVTRISCLARLEVQPLAGSPPLETQPDQRLKINAGGLPDTLMTS